MAWLARAFEKLRAILRVPLRYLQAVQEHNLFTHAAAVAFFLFLSLPPALLALVSLIGLIPIEDWTEATTFELIEWGYWCLGLIMPADQLECLGLGYEIRFQPTLMELDNLSSVHVNARLGELLEERVHEDVADSLSGIIENILGNPRRGLLTVSFLTILWSASGVTRAAMRAMSAIYEVKHRSLLGRNALSLLLTVGFLATWTLALALLPVSNTLGRVVVNYFGFDQGVHLLWSSANWAIGALILLVSVLSLNRFGPDVELRVRALLPGSLLSVALWVLLTQALGRWLENSWGNYNATYGALASIIVLLLWCYLMAIGLLLGAELNTAILRFRQRGLAGDEGDLHEATREAVEAELAPSRTTLVARAREQGQIE